MKKIVYCIVTLCLLCVSQDAFAVSNQKEVEVVVKEVHSNASNQDVKMQELALEISEHKHEDAFAESHKAAVELALVVQEKEMHNSTSNQDVKMQELALEISEHKHEDAFTESNTKSNNSEG